MARNREFDYQEVLNKALDLFWRKGYHNTSVQDLVDDLGIGRGSLYNTYGSKHDLFLEALDDYLVRRDATLSQNLKVSPIKEAFRKLLYDLVDEIIDDEESRGCFIVNTMTELASDDIEVTKRVKKSEQQLVGCFMESLSLAKEHGELSIDQDPRKLALFFSNTMKGLRVISKINPSREDLEAIVNTALTIFN